MTENLQRTEQVITETELREILDDEDDKTFADLTSRGVAEVRGALGVARRTAGGDSGRTPVGQMMIDIGSVMFVPISEAERALMHSLEQGSEQTEKRAPHSFAEAHAAVPWVV